MFDHWTEAIFKAMEQIRGNSYMRRCLIFRRYTVRIIGAWQEPKPRASNDNVFTIREK